MQSKRTFGQTLTAVAWSFVGLRRRGDFERDVGAFNPLYVIAGAVLGVTVFISTLLIVVRLVVH
jgi:hypothetical protein